MRFPKFPSVRLDKVLTINEFWGYNATPACAPSEFSEMKNLSSINFPAVSPISKPVKLYQGVADIFAYEDVILKITEEGDLYIGGEKLLSGLSLSSREYSVLGKYLIIMPDGLYYDLKAKTLGSLSSDWSGKGSFIKGDVFDSGLYVNTLKGQNVNFAVYFSEGDCIEVKNGSDSLGFFTVLQIKGEYILFENGDFEEGTELSITLERKIPRLQNTFECNNRLWGTEDNCIFASSLGDPFNFYKYRGISTDSYFKEIYSAGEFTAGVSYGETPVFFKERGIYRIYGTQPEDFHTDVKEAPGVSQGCDESVTVLDGSIYYAGDDGIYRYSSAYPEKISSRLGSLKIGSAFGGSDGKRYFVSFSKAYGIKQSMSEFLADLYNTVLYAYDHEKRTWYKYDEALKVKKILTGPYGSGLKKQNTIALCRDGQVFTLSEKLGAGLAGDVEYSDNKSVESFGITGDIDLGPLSRINSIRLSAKVEKESELYGEISFDGGKFHRFCSVVGDGAERKYTFRVPKVRFSSCRLKLGGVGEYLIKNLELYYSPSRSRER